MSLSLNRIFWYPYPLLEVVIPISRCCYCSRTSRVRADSKFVFSYVSTTQAWFMDCEQNQICSICLFGSVMLIFSGPFVNLHGEKVGQFASGLRDKMVDESSCQCWALMEIAAAKKLHFLPHTVRVVGERNSPAQRSDIKGGTWMMPIFET